MEILGYTISSSLLWIAVAVVFAVVEAFTMGLYTIWFTLGAVAAGIVSIAGGSVLIQVIVFLTVSILLLYFTRPLAEKKLKIGREKTNVEALPGRMALVVKDITPYNAGQVKAAGQIWTATSEIADANFKEGSTVEIVGVEGVKLIVKALEDN
jgi:membrane protein implicated in regulation of membrane protease activity